ncbi:hypothetical protein RHGRI_030717 [Rhododendron griersonianum]|uniref:Uncharacterized protein n=1 Tax=Rhododendron griersonianum TaxID=479676 RepID=A0AAV6IB08_9ERIC|nr:hypothetical protein RHGRI_030717 [Rhododendron griersonianum]
MTLYAGTPLAKKFLKHINALPSIPKNIAPEVPPPITYKKKKQTRALVTIPEVPMSPPKATNVLRKWKKKCKKPPLGLFRSQVSFFSFLTLLLLAWYNKLLFEVSL